MDRESGVRKTTIVLSIVWRESIRLCSIGSYAWDAVLHLQTGCYTRSLLEAPSLCMLFLVALYFLPMLIVIRCFAKRAEIKPICIISLILIIFFSVWLSMDVVFTMLALFGIGA